ncbi:toxin [Bacillus cereus]|uniref:TULIP family P47-like protein n=1 Tax=Bacillus cereus TaxID=1396 RepID=UPI000BF5C524|nr:TULIP family P47-like protein [Bacillus cereus]PEY87918.1 toxin [Bacillus cereus]PGV99680.1 toxin [Bacillus cereus]PGY27009.1 toxin [Bacillus cereus]
MKYTHSTSTLNWDTVFAVPISEVNRMIKEQKSSPKDFELKDLNNNNFKGEFNDWQITTGGDGNSIRMKLPIRNFHTFLQDEFLNGEFGFQSGDLYIQVKLNYLPHESVTKKDEKEELYNLKIKTTSKDPIDPVVIGISLKMEGLFFPSSLNNMFINLEDILAEYFMYQITTWLTLNLAEFNHVFNVVNLNLYISNEEPWEWCRPSYVDYAYTDVEENLDKSLLGVLCMTGGRSAGIHQQHKLDAYVIPKPSNSGFLIAEERFLQEVFLPTLPMQFKNSITDDYEIVNASGEAGQYQYTLQLKENKAIKLEKVAANGSNYTPYLKELKLNLIGDEMRLETYTETPIYAGVTAFCRTINRYRIILAKNKFNEQTITYEQIGEPTMVKGTINEGSLLPWVIAIVEIITLAILGSVTAGATFLVAGLVVTLIYGTIALLPEIYESLNVETSPSVDLLLENTTSQIIWGASETFELNYAGLAGPIQLGGRFVI